MSSRPASGAPPAAAGSTAAASSSAPPAAAAATTAGAAPGAAAQQQPQPGQTSGAAASSSSSSRSSSRPSTEVIAVPCPQYPGFHEVTISGCKLLIDVKYMPLKCLGRGAYGVVCSASDSQANRRVAIKKIPKAFEDLVDAKRILREVKLLRHFHHDNIVGLRDLVGPPRDVPGEPFDDIYIILDFMETDLHKIIYSKNELTDEHIQYFIYQILRALKYIHSAHVIHRDLKPSNLLVNSNCDLKICDFGLARGFKEEEGELTEYVVTRWYRAPEVMCSCQEYDHKIDVWSVGCILAELHGRKPLFPGDDYIKQMNLIFGVLGTPSKSDMGFISNDKALEYIKSLDKKPKIPFSRIYPDANPLALDLLERMLTFNPERRISVGDALRHPYLAGLHNAKKEMDCKIPFDFEFEKIDMTKEALQDFMWEEIYNFRPHLRVPPVPAGGVPVKRTAKYFAAREAIEAKKRAAAAAAAAANPVKPKKLGSKRSSERETKEGAPVSAVNGGGGGGGGPAPAGAPTGAAATGGPTPAPAPASAPAPPGGPTR